MPFGGHINVEKDVLQSKSTFKIEVTPRVTGSVDATVHVLHPGNRAPMVFPMHLDMPILNLSSDDADRTRQHQVALERNQRLSEERDKLRKLLERVQELRGVGDWVHLDDEIMNSFEEEITRLSSSTVATDGVRDFQRQVSLPASGRGFVSGANGDSHGCDMVPGGLCPPGTVQVDDVQVKVREAEVCAMPLVEFKANLVILGNAALHSPEDLQSWYASQGRGSFAMDIDWARKFLQQAFPVQEGRQCLTTLWSTHTHTYYMLRRFLKWETPGRGERRLMQSMS
jgi:hypothetical protein